MILFIWVYKFLTTFYPFIPLCVKGTSNLRLLDIRIFEGDMSVKNWFYKKLHMHSEAAL